MKCKFCENPATVHLTDIINKKKRELHLCEACARQHDLIPEPSQELNIPALLQFLISQSPGELTARDANNDACPQCGLKYAQFRAQGRLGCPEDYEVFRAVLEPLLEKIHRHTKHTGKTPARFRDRQVEARKQELQGHLQDAIREERYEEAARLRDLIRIMGTADESR